MSGATGRYIRVSASRSQPLRAYDFIRDMPGQRNLTVVDLDFRSPVDLPLAWASIHDVPDRLANTDDVVFIWPEVVLANLGTDPVEPIVNFRREALDREGTLGSPTTISVLAHRMGDEPFLLAPAEIFPRLLATVRSLEINALMAEGGAEITPESHHFRLPSGKHARSFLRLANALRSPRDIWALAAWLTPRIRDGVGVVTDTTTLAPVLAQLQSFADRANVDMGPTVVLDRYPRSRLEVSQAVEEAAAFSRALALLSVSSSGTIRGHFEDALRRYAPDEWALEVVVEARQSARRVPPPIDERRSVWTEFETSPMSANRSQCPHCADAQRAHVVRIDERSFLPLAEPTPAIYMPSTNEGANHAFWELANTQNAVHVESLPSPDNGARAERVALGVKIDFDRLTENPANVALAIKSRIEDLQRPGRKPTQVINDAHVSKVLANAHAATVVYCTEPDERRAAVLHALSCLGVAKPRIHFAPADLQNDPDKAATDSILCFSLGSVTGASLKRLRVQATDCYKGLEPSINGLCLHARPPTSIEWRAMLNAFRPGRLAALWLCHLPWTSPLRTELDLLERAEHATKAIGNRLRYLRDTQTTAGDEDYEETALWGSNEMFNGQQHVRERSIYGYELGTNAAYAAIGAAVHARRLEHAEKPSAQRFMVDLPKVARSYFDAILMASVLRWTKPGEAWWGEDPSEEQETMESFLRFGASTKEEVAVLYPELLVAAALGKVPDAAVEVLRTRYELLRQQFPIDAANAGPHRTVRFAMIDELFVLLDDRNA